eukprot:jgi/Mesen1/6402/ME000329S05563
MRTDDSGWDILNDFLVKELQPISEADPSLLASYVAALLKNNKPRDELQLLCIEQLQDFLADETEPFVEKLFVALADGTIKVVLDDTVSDDTRVERVVEADDVEGSESKKDPLDRDSGKPSKHEGGPEAVEAGKARSHEVSGAARKEGTDEQEDVIAERNDLIEDEEESSEDDDDRNHKHRRRGLSAKPSEGKRSDVDRGDTGGRGDRRPLRGDRSSGDRAHSHSGNMRRDMDRPRRDMHGRFDNRDAHFREPVGPGMHGRHGPNGLNNRGPPFRGDGARPRFEGPGGRDAPRGMRFGRGMGDGWGPNGPDPREPGFSGHSQFREFPEIIGQGPGMFPAPGPNMHNRGPGPWARLGPGPGGPRPAGMGLLPDPRPGGPGRPGPGMGAGTRRPRCQDFEERGFCLRGDLCPMDHGANRIVVDDMHSLQQLHLPISAGPHITSGPGTAPLGIPGHAQVAARRGQVEAEAGELAAVKRNGAGVVEPLGGGPQVLEGEHYDPDQLLWSRDHKRLKPALGAPLANVGYAPPPTDQADGGLLQQRLDDGEKPGGSVWDRIGPPLPDAAEVDMLGEERRGLKRERLGLGGEDEPAAYRGAAEAEVPYNLEGQSRVSPYVPEESAGFSRYSPGPRPSTHGGSPYRPSLSASVLASEEHRESLAGGPQPGPYISHMPNAFERGGGGGGGGRGGQGRGQFHQQQQQQRPEGGHPPGSAAGATPAPSEEPQAQCTLFVGGLPVGQPDVEQQLGAHFQKFGTVVDMHMRYAKDEKTCLAYVQLASRDEALKALADPDPILGSRFVHLKWARRDCMPVPAPRTYTAPGYVAPQAASLAGGGPRSSKPFAPPAHGSAEAGPGAGAGAGAGADGGANASQLNGAQANGASGGAGAAPAAASPAPDLAAMAAASLKEREQREKQEQLEKLQRLQAFQKQKEAALKEQIEKHKKMLEALARSKQAGLSKDPEAAGSSQAGTAAAAAASTPRKQASANGAATPLSSEAVTPGGAAAAGTGLGAGGAQQAQKGAEGAASEAGEGTTQRSSSPAAAQRAGVRPPFVRGMPPGAAAVHASGYRSPWHAPVRHNKIDNRSTVLRVLPPIPKSATDVAMLWDHFSFYGEVLSVESEAPASSAADGGADESSVSEDAAVRLVFAKRSAAENAIAQGKFYQGVTLQLAWGPAMPAVQKRSLVSPGLGAPAFNPTGSSHSAFGGNSPGLKLSTVGTANADVGKHTLEASNLPTSTSVSSDADKS